MTKKTLAVITMSALSASLFIGCSSGTNGTTDTAGPPATSAPADPEPTFVIDEAFCTLVARADELAGQVDEAYFPITFYKTYIPPTMADGSELVDPDRLAELQDAGTTVRSAATEQAEVYRTLASLTSDQELMDAFLTVAGHLDDVVAEIASIAASSPDFVTYRSGLETLGWLEKSAYLDSEDYNLAFFTIYLDAYVPCGVGVEG